MSWDSRSAALALVAVLAAPALLAGCLGATSEGAPAAPLPASGGALPAPTYGEMVAEPLPFEASDGVTLDMWVWRPVAEGETFPVILQDSPYYGNLDPPASEGGQPFSEWLVRTFVPRGYAVVLKSVRGTGDSGGCFGMGDAREALDGAEAVEFLATQPWSSGPVAMIGKSYRGTTPIQTAVLAPPHLKTIVPIAGITEWYLYTNSPGGVAYAGWLGFNTNYQVTVGFDSGRPSPDDPMSALRYAEKVCPAVAELSTMEARSIATGETNEGWESRNYAKDVSKMTASVYLVHGLLDWNVKPDQIGAWFNAVETPKRALLGQWPHEYPDRVDWDVDLFNWFEHELKGVANGVGREPPVKVEDSTGAWRFESQWPPVRAETRSLALGADGALHAAAADAKRGALAFRMTPGSEPAGPAGATGSQLVFATPAFDAPFRVAGVPTLAFNATLDRAQAIFAVEMYDVNGTTWTPINWAFLDSRHRDGLAESTPVVPLAATRFPLQFFPMDHAFLPGHSLAIAIAGADPDWIAHPANGASVVVEAGPGSTLDLPVVETVLLESPQPETREFDALDWYQASG